MKILACFLIGYLIGTINPSYLLGRVKGIDIRHNGSHNAGASNAIILFGKTVGIICALFDIFKAFAAIMLTRNLFSDFAYAFPITGVACVLGHTFPFYMRFKGGKGLACLGGMILLYDVRVFLIMLVASVVIVLVTDYICFVPLTASVAFPIIYGVMEKDFFGMLILFAITAVMLFKHIENIKKILSGKELHFSFLWHKEKELERITDSNENE